MNETEPKDNDPKIHEGSIIPDQEPDNTALETDLDPLNPNAPNKHIELDEHLNGLFLFFFFLMHQYYM